MMRGVFVRLGRGMSNCLGHSYLSFKLAVLRVSLIRRLLEQGGSGLLLIPFVEIRLRHNLDLGLHIIVSLSTQLAASQIVRTDLGRHKPDPVDSADRHGI